MECGGEFEVPRGAIDADSLGSCTQGCLLLSGAPLDVLREDPHCVRAVWKRRRAPVEKVPLPPLRVVEETPGSGTNFDPHLRHCGGRSEANVLNRSGEGG